ncbi:MAG: esterase family protein [Bacteroidota bacterium]
MNILLRVALATALLTLSYSLHAQSLHAIPLESGMHLEKSISADEYHIYSIDLENGMALVGELQQQGIRLVIDVMDTNGNLARQIRGPRSVDGTVEIDFTAPATGRYTLTVRSLDSEEAAGAYRLRVTELVGLADNTLRAMKRELPTETLFKLWEASLTDPAAVESFLDQHEQQHLIEPIEGNEGAMLVTYFCVPSPNTEYVMLSGGPDFLGLRFQRLPNTELYFVTQQVPKDARFSYGFNYFLLEKAGPNGEVERREVEHAYDGVVEMPDAPAQPYITLRMGVTAGAIMPTSLTSEIMGEERNITIHTPANYDASQPHNLLIVLDGETNGGRPGRRARIPAPTILDNLMAEEKISPTVTVLVWNMRGRSQLMLRED